MLQEWSNFFHEDDVSHLPLFLHKYKLLLLVFSEGIGIDIGVDDEKPPITVDKASK